MAMNNPIQVVLEFEKLINTRNPGAICALMTSDGEFIDSLGTRIQRTEKLRTAWAGYFKMVPDYSISHSEIFADGKYSQRFWLGAGDVLKRWPTCERKFLEDPGGVACRSERRADVTWQVYADNEPIRAIMRKVSEGWQQGKITVTDAKAAKINGNPGNLSILSVLGDLCGERYGSANCFLC